MDLHSVGQGILEHYVAGLMIMATGILLGLLRKYKEKWAEVVLYALGGGACLAVLIFVFTGQPILTKQVPVITTDNIEENAKTWLNAFGYGVVVLSDNSAYFALEASSPDRLSLVTIRRTKTLEGYLLIDSALHIDEKHGAMLNKLPRADQIKLVHDVRIQVIKFGCGFSDITLPLEKVSVQKQVPITETMTQYSFIESVRDVSSAILVANETITREIGD